MIIVIKPTSDNGLTVDWSVENKRRRLEVKSSKMYISIRRTGIDYWNETVLASWLGSPPWRRDLSRRKDFFCQLCFVITIPEKIRESCWCFEECKQMSNRKSWQSLKISQAYDFFELVMVWISENNVSRTNIPSWIWINSADEKKTAQVQDKTKPKKNDWWNFEILNLQ